MRFSFERYIDFLLSNDRTWYNKINGKEVEFSPDSNISRCDGYFVLREWCEPINDSDNNDK